MPSPESGRSRWEAWRAFWPTPPQRQRKPIALVIFAIAVVSSALVAYIYWIRWQPAPARGGGYTEGLLGEPRFLNPLLSLPNETDRDLTTLIFAGLTRHDENGEIVGDLAEKFVAENRGRIYKFTLRENLRWNDGEPLTIEDVLFTIKLIQDPLYQIPLRSNWQGVRAEKIDERTIQLILPVPFASFLENTTVGILPKHLWENIDPQNFALSELNLGPVGAGPYRVKKLTKTGDSIETIELDRNKNYHGETHIGKITFRFYDSEDSLLAAYRRGEIEAMSLFSPRTKEDVAARGGRIFSLPIPRYFAIFFNQKKNATLKERSVRLALAHALNRAEIIERVFESEAVAVEGPLPPRYFDDSVELTTYKLDLERARDLIGDEETARSFTVTTADLPELTQAASLLQQQWGKIGIRVNLDIVPTSEIQQQTIRPREFEALLFGEALGITPDPFSFWHSSQVKDPGLNLSLYANEKADDLLESARQTLEPAEQQRLYAQFEEIIRRDLPAVFLYSPNYLYVLPAKIKGFSQKIIGTPAQRFEGVAGWYIKTKRE